MHKTTLLFSLAATLLVGPTTNCFEAAAQEAGEIIEPPAFVPESTEFVEMLTALLTGSPVGPGSGWFHPAVSRYSWGWLAAKHRISPIEKIAKADFRGPADLFDRLDRDKDGVLSADDFKPTRTPRRPPPEATAPTLTKTPPSSDMPDEWTLLKGLFNGEIGSAGMGPKLEQLAPDFTLRTPDRKQTVQLSSFRDKNPVVLVFGSFT